MFTNSLTCMIGSYILTYVYGGEKSWGKFSMDEKQMHKFWDCVYVFFIVSSILWWQLGDGFGG